MSFVSNVQMTSAPHRLGPPATSAVRGSVLIPQLEHYVTFSSITERNFLVLATMEPDLVSIAWEPFSLRYFDERQQKSRRYTPDYLACFGASDGSLRELLIDTKAKSFLHKNNVINEANFDAAHQWSSGSCARHFAVVTETDMKSVGLEAAERLYLSLVTEMDQWGIDAIEHWIGERSPIKFADAIADLECETAATRSFLIEIVLGLIARGRLSIDMASLPFTMDTLIHGKRLPGPLQMLWERQ